MNKNKPTALMPGLATMVSRDASSLPSYDGYVHAELSNQPISYHISRCYPGVLSEVECQRFALASCRIACMSMDVIRGRIPPRKLQRVLNASCLRRLETMAYLLENHLRTHRELKARLAYLPAMPTLVYGTLVSPDTTETVVNLMIGKDSYWVNLVLKRTGSRWVCTTADLG